MDFNMFGTESSPAMDCSGVTELMTVSASSAAEDTLHQLLSDFVDEKELENASDTDESCFYFLSNLEMPCRLNDDTLPNADWTVTENKENSIPGGNVEECQNQFTSIKPEHSVLLESEVTQPIDFDVLTGEADILSPFKALAETRSDVASPKHRSKLSEIRTGHSEKSIQENFQLSKTTTFKKLPSKTNPLYKSKPSPTEKIFKLMTDTFNQYQISIKETIRQEMELGVNSLKTYFDEKWSTLGQPGSNKQIVPGIGFSQPFPVKSSEGHFILGDCSDSTTPSRDNPQFDLSQSAPGGPLLTYVKSGSLVETLTKSVETQDTSGDQIESSPQDSELIQDKDPSESTESFAVILPGHEIKPETQVKKEEKTENDAISKSALPTPAVPVKATISKTTKVKPERIPRPELQLRKAKTPLVCDVCDRSFPNNSSLKQHKSFHFTSRPFECSHEDCNKSYKTKSELNRHLIVHSGEKNYECQKCGKAFLRKQYLKTHLIRHNEDLIWKCNWCTKVFVSERDLDKHKTSYHKKEKRSSSKAEVIKNYPEITLSP